MAEDKIAKVNLDLDTLEREQVRGVPKKRDPYAVNFKGHVLTFADPLDVPAPILMQMEDTPTRFFLATLSDDDYEHMMNHFHELTGLKLRGLMQGYRVYYGLDDPGNGVGSRR